MLRKSRVRIAVSIFLTSVAVLAVCMGALVWSGHASALATARDSMRAAAERGASETSVSVGRSKSATSTASPVPQQADGAGSPAMPDGDGGDRPAKPDAASDDAEPPAKPDADDPSSGDAAPPKPSSDATGGHEVGSGEASGSSRLLAPCAVFEVDADGNVTSDNSGSVAMDAALAAALVAEAAASDGDEGYSSEADVYWLAKRSSDGSFTVAASDAWRVRSATAQLARAAVPWSLVGVGVLAVLSALLSRFAVRPAAEAAERQARFVADASHELKTPLAVISADASILSRELAGTRSGRWADAIADEAASMRCLVESMLELARDDADAGIPVEAERIDLSDLVAESAMGMEAAAFEAGVGIDWFDLGDHVACSSNHDDATRLIRILLDNAVKYSAGNVRATVSEKEGSPTLEVWNDGDPIPEDTLPHVFERFVRADASRTTDGYGLGLSIAKAAADRNGMRLTVESGEAGTTFTVVFAKANGSSMTDGK